MAYFTNVSMLIVALMIHTSYVNASVGSSCSSSSQCKIPEETCTSSVCDCYHRYYKDESNASNIVCRVYRHSEVCDRAKSSICQTSGAGCRLAEDSIDRCICYSSVDFYQPAIDKCSSVSDLAVTVTSTNITATTITFTWNADNKGIPVNYTITWNSGPGIIDYVNKTGGRLYDLESYSYYFLELITIVPGNSYYSKKTATTYRSVTTEKISYGDTCSKAGDSYYCNNQNTDCIQTPSSNGLRCLCDDRYYITPSVVCESLSRLTVTLTSTQVTSQTATFMWNADNRGIPVYYTITWSSGTGTIDYVNSTGARLYNLQPYTRYTFYLQTIVPANSYYSEKTASTTISIQTRSSEGENSGMIVGIVVAVIAVAALAVILGIVYWKRRQSRETRKTEYDQPNNSGVTGEDNYAHFDLTGQETDASTSVCAESGNIPLRPVPPAPNNHSSHIYDTVIDGNADGDYELPLEKQDGEHKDHVYMNI